MRIIVACLLLSLMMASLLVNSLDHHHHQHQMTLRGGIRSQMLERLMMIEDNDNDDDDTAALRRKRTINALRQLFPSISQDINGAGAAASETISNQVQDASVSPSENTQIKVQFKDDNISQHQSADELLPLDDIEISNDDDDDENRNKRFLSFGQSSNNNAAASTTASSGGSGNFLFDIIRQAADGAARAAGTVYRVVAGTQSLGLGLSASRDLGPSPPAPSAAATAAGAPTVAAPAAPPAPGAGTQPPSLVAGSGSAATDPGVAGGGATPGGRTDPEAVPGPITRLFVIANRGISNLIQDIILRLAATSERIVNFKARLITSII